MSSSTNHRLPASGQTGDDGHDVGRPAVPAPWRQRLIKRTTDRTVAAGLSAVSAAVYGFAAGLRLQSPPAGDEPHYLLQTLAFVKYHSIDPTLAYEHHDYWSFYPAELAAHTSIAANGTVLPLHNPGGPILWIVPYLLGGRTGVAVFQVLIAVLVVVNIFLLLRQLEVRRSYAGFVTILFLVGSPLYVYASMLFVELIGALFVIYAVRQALVPRRSAMRLVISSAGLGYLPLVHGRFAIFTLTVGALLAVRVFAEVGRRRAWPYLHALGPLVTVASAFEVFILLRYGTLNPAPGNANLGAGIFQVSIYEGFLSLVFDRVYGLIPYFPVVALAIPGIVLAWQRRLAWVHVVLLGTVVPYVLAISTFGMWWGGFSPPTRFLSVIAPLLAYYVAVCLVRVNSWWLNTLAGLASVWGLAVGFLGDVDPPDRFDSGYHTGHLLMDRVSGHVGIQNLGRFFPSVLLPGGDVALFTAWTLTVVVLSLFVWALGRRRTPVLVPGLPEMGHMSPCRLVRRILRAPNGNKLTARRRAGRSSGRCTLLLVIAGQTSKLRPHARRATDRGRHPGIQRSWATHPAHPCDSTGSCGRGDRGQRPVDR